MRATGSSCELDGRSYDFRFADPPAIGEADAARGGSLDGRVTAPMPGKIVKIAVREGEAVAERALLIVLEAMKMEHRIEASTGAKVKAVLVRRADRRQRRAAGRTRINRMNRLPKTVTLFEMGARDGLQNEDAIVPTDAKVRFIDLLSESGLRWIEATSFVSPKAIPQLADAGDVFARIRKAPGVRYPVLTSEPQRLRACHEPPALTRSRSSPRPRTSFTRRNINMTIDESLDVFRDVVRAAKNDGVWVRGYVSTAFGSPFGDPVTPRAVVDVSVKLMEMGCDALSIGDTIGVGVPSQVDELVPLLVEKIPLDTIAFHFHDTRGTALANVYAALAARHCRVRLVGRRLGRLSVRARRDRQRRHRRRALSPAPDGRRNRSRPREGPRRLAVHRGRRRSRPHQQNLSSAGNRRALTFH